MDWLDILRIVLAAITAAGSAVAFRHFLHMFQLNSYKPHVQRQWEEKNRKQFFWKLRVPLAGGFFFWPKPKEQVKIPLKYTARVKRLIATAAVLTALWYVFIMWLVWIGDLDRWWFVFCELVYLWVWQTGANELVRLANWINGPMEKAIRGRYTKDAMKKLDAHSNLTVIGITGSYGKTSMKHYLNTLLRAKFNVLMTPGSINTPMGVVKVVREELNAAHEIFICEMGAKQGGDIRELCEIARPQYGILTSVGPQHLESFLTIENVVATKFELANALPSDGMLFANADNEYIANHLEKYSNVTMYSAGSEGNGYHTKDIAVSERGTAFTIVTPAGEEERFETRLIGEHNVVNLAGAITVAAFLGIPLKKLRGEMRKIEPVAHRLELFDRGDTLVIDDSYNSNPAGAKAALDTLALFAGMKILVTPGMIELGPKQEELNKVFGTQAAAVCDVIVLVGAAQTEPIQEGVLEAGFAPERLIVVDTLREGMARVNAMPSAHRKVILLENDLPDNF